MMTDKRFFSRFERAVACERKRSKRKLFPFRANLETGSCTNQARPTTVKKRLILYSDDSSFSPYLSRFNGSLLPKKGFI